MLVIGGARSGKSRHAAERAAGSGLEPVLVATAQALDTEMALRIARHRIERAPGWRVIEEPLALAECLAAESSRARILVVGDVMLDHFVWGNVRRISPEAPVPVVEVVLEQFLRTITMD